MQIDVTANMTLDVDENELIAYIESEKWDEDEVKVTPDDYDEYLLDFVSQELEGEEISSVSGTAWICSIDDVGII
jgi:hypothetical protein